MKKWLITLCCFLIAGVIAFVAFLNNSNAKIDILNKDLGDMQAEYNSLNEKSEKDDKTIEDLNLQVEDLNHQVEDLNLQVENLTAEKDLLTAEKDQLTEALDGLNRNLSSSQQKLQEVLYILTDGEQGSIDSLLYPYIKIFQDVPLNDPYFDAVSFVNDNQLMASLGEEVFGAGESATLGEFAESLYLLQEKTGTRAEATASLLQAEQAWLASLTPSAAGEPSPEPAAEEAPAPAEEPAGEEAEAEETEVPVEEPAAEEAEAPAEETEAKEAEAPAEETAAEEAEAHAEEPAAEDAEAAETEAPVEEPTAAEPETEEPAEDETLILTRERLLSLCCAYSFETGKDIPEITFPESDSEEATRGDLAVALMILAR